MAIQFLCTACGQPIEVDDEMANQAVTCPYCRRVVTTPATTTLRAGDAPPASGTAGPGEEGAVPGAVVGAAQRPKSSLLGWISLGCVVVSVLCLIYVAVVTTSMLQGLNLQPTTPDEVKEMQRILKERAQSKPGFQAIAVGGSCVVPLAGVVCAIVALAKGSRPRWPAILGLVLLAGLVVLSCLGALLQMMSGPGQAGP
ncbi:MAG: hypothetical protein JXQ75_18950 [Phycisphaerae bacterium]|nr:hypothetical protein [Phycisphaerae bacterium]